MKSGMAMLSRIVLGLGVMMGTWSTTRAQDPNAMMTPPPPMTDSTLLNLVGGAWGGDLTMGDQTMFGEAQFNLGVGQQWIVANFGIWSDKTRAKALPMGFVMYLRPGATAGSYKGVQIAGDGSVGNGTATKTGNILNWSWTYDNGMKETGTLTMMTADHVVYKASISDGAGNKIMEFQHEMHRTKEK